MSTQLFYPRSASNLRVEHERSCGYELLPSGRETMLSRNEGVAALSAGAVQEGGSKKIAGEHRRDVGRQ